jgi:hypothetical protein
MKSFVTTCTIILFLSSNLFASSNNTSDKKENKTATTTLSGKVIEFDNNEGITGAEIKIINTGEIIYTDFDGNFNVTLPEGEYDLEVKMISYKDLKLRKVKATSNSPMVFKLHEL